MQHRFAKRYVPELSYIRHLKHEELYLETERLITSIFKRTPVNAINFQFTLHFCQALAPRMVHGDSARHQQLWPACECPKQTNLR
jgi:hypothetical protein